MINVRNICDDLLIFAVYEAKITQKCSKYDLMTNSVKLCNKWLQQYQKETVVFVTNTCLQSTYLKNSRKVKTDAEKVHPWYKHKLPDVYAIHWCDLHQWLSAAAHVTHQLSTASVRIHHKSSSEHCCIVFHIL